MPEGRPQRWRILVLLVPVLVLLVVGLLRGGRGSSNGTDEAGATTTAGNEPSTAASTVPVTTRPAPVTTVPPTTIPYDGWVNPASFGQPWPDATTTGYLTFRGNPTRSWLGAGPVPSAPQVLWRYPAEGSMCSLSSQYGETTQWCGIGYTGQVSTWARPDGSTWLLFGGFDDRYHAVDARTGTDAVAPLEVGDLPKGSGTLDPDGYPLYYAGARDGKLRVIALDRPALETLWSYDAKAVKPTIWNDDWDAAPLVLDDFLFAGGENSRMQIFRLDRAYAADGRVTVAPRLLWSFPGWDEQLLADVGDRNVSIETSPSISGNTLWFANSGGLVQGWDISGVEQGVTPTRVFRLWSGDDTDTSIVVDAEGFLYFGSQNQRGTARARETGQLVKVDPSKPDDPVVWGYTDDSGAAFQGSAGVWATPIVYDDVVIALTGAGRLFAVDRATGAELWRARVGAPAISSPLYVDGVLVVGDCTGTLQAFDLPDPRQAPTPKWSVELGACVEATPTLWDGRIYVGTRGGALYALGD